MNKFPSIRRNSLTTLQVNIGYKCNQKCAHCHVNASPERTEMMKSDTIKLIPKVLESYRLDTLDLTGGAPELHPQFQELVVKAREIGVEVIDRCNLTILNEPGFEYLAKFLAENKVTIIASLPCYEKDNVDKQRGKGVFERSLEGLNQLNQLGYGKNNSDLKLNLVFNPQGISLPPPQAELESVYKKELFNRYGILFDNLYTIANMPINRFASHLKSMGQLKDYQKLLEEKYNPSNLDNLMCRSIISVDWEGILYDCDFNQQLGLKMKGKYKNLEDLVNNNDILINQEIETRDHCYGCTAGDGSSCGGALKNKY